MTTPRHSGADGGEAKEYSLPRGVEPLMDGPPPPSPEELELQREMDDLTDADDMFRDEGE